MAKKCKKTECPAGEKWAVPYADFLSLLLALFIALYAISAQNTEKVKALKTEFIKIFDYAPKPEAPQPVVTIPPNPGKVKDTTSGKMKNKSTQLNAPITVVTITQLSNLIQDGGLLEQIEQGVTLRLPSDILFQQDSADLIDKDRQTELSLLASLIEKMPRQVQINVKGYTSNLPTSNFANHYELAGKRAYNVMEFLRQNNVDPNRLSYTSYGKYHSLLPNDTLTHQMANDRVELFFSTTKDSVKEVKGVLDKLETQY